MMYKERQMATAPIGTQTRLAGKRSEVVWTEVHRLNNANYKRAFKNKHRRKSMVGGCSGCGYPARELRARCSIAAHGAPRGVHPVEHDGGPDANGGHRRKRHERVRCHPGKGHACAEPAMGCHGELPSLEPPWSPRIWDGRTKWSQHRCRREGMAHDVRPCGEGMKGNDGGNDIKGKGNAGGKNIKWQGHGA